MTAEEIRKRGDLIDAALDMGLGIGEEENGEVIIFTEVITDEFDYYPIPKKD